MLVHKENELKLCIDCKYSHRIIGWNMQCTYGGERIDLVTGFNDLVHPSCREMRYTPNNTVLLIPPCGEQGRYFEKKD